MAELPETAKVVIIGLGGIVGASVAHHLIARGWDDIVGIDKSAIPTDIGSTSHASDFCYLTAHDPLSCYTTRYSVDFFEQRGRYARVGGLEVARVGDDARMLELKRKVGSAKAFGTRARMISPQEARERFPLLAPDTIQGALWDPDAGLVVPRSQQVAGELVDEAVASGRLRAFANLAATGLDIRDGRICAVHTRRGSIRAEHVIVCAGLWGRLVAEMAGEDLPIMPVDHPLLWFGPYTEFAGTGKHIGYPLLRDQGNSAYMRDTGDPDTSEGGYIEWGYYEERAPRMVHPRDILEKEQARLSPSQRDLDMEQVIEPLERAMELTPVLAELGWDDKRSFNGLLQVTADGNSVVGESARTRGLWYCEAIWVKDAPGMAKLLADWMTDGHTPIDIARIDVGRFYPVQQTRHFIDARCHEAAFKIYNPPVHTREPSAVARDLRRSPFWPREQALGGYFMEAAGWERAHGYAANETRLEQYLEQVPERPHEWDRRHHWCVSNAEQLAMSASVGMINLSHFAVYDVHGPQAEHLLEYLCVARVGGATAIGQGVYTHFLDAVGGIRADLSVIRLGASRWRVICGGDTGHRDYLWMRRMAEDCGWRVCFEDLTDQLACLGVWGPHARETLQRLCDRPEQLEPDAFGFATARALHLAGLPVLAYRISYVGEQGWELHVPFSHGLALWDALFGLGVIPVGIETYANSRRLEKSLRLQNADLLTEYTLCEAGLARPRVKAADFHGKTAYLEQRARAVQHATLCTLVMTDNVDVNGVPRYPVGQWPVVEPRSREVLRDAIGRRSYVTSIAYGPSLGVNIALAYLPAQWALQGMELAMEYFDEVFPLRVAAVGHRALYDPENGKPRS
jgi:glycine cleavage system aminomethyltransferase T/glycine/D-amino acid oxidase-like deaminating enzyme